MGFSDWVTDKLFQKTIDQKVTALVETHTSEKLEQLEKAWKELPVAKEPDRPQRTVSYDPFGLITSLGFKHKPTTMSYDMLRAIGKQLGVIGNIVAVRTNQVAAFSQPQHVTKTVGFVIKHKEPGHIYLKSEKKFVYEMEEYMCQCGRGPSPYREGPRDDFDTFLRKITPDSLLLDQSCFEVVPDREGKPFEFIAVDGASIRIATGNPDDILVSKDYSRQMYAPPLYANNIGHAVWDGKRAAFVQLINGMVYAVYSFEDLVFGVRNPRTDIYVHGYGYSELERIIATITSHLFAEEFNRRQFTNGSIPKGILNIKSAENIPPEQLEAFKRLWMAQVASVENAWRTPVLNADGLEYVDLSKNNRDAEYMEWVKYLIKVSAGAYLIDPAEINFDMGNGATPTPLFDQPNESKLKSSKDRGLRPLLKHIASLLNRGVINRIDTNYRFEFVGLDEPSEEQKMERRKLQVATTKTINQLRKEDGDEPLPGGDIVLSPMYLQSLQMVKAEEQRLQQEQMMLEQQQEQPQEVSPRTGIPRGLDRTGAVSSQMHQEAVATGGPGKDKRLPRGMDNKLKTKKPDEESEYAPPGPEQPTKPGEETGAAPPPTPGSGRIVKPGTRGPYKTSHFAHRHWNGRNWVYDYKEHPNLSHAEHGDEAAEYARNKVSHSVPVDKKKTEDLGISAEAAYQEFLQEGARGGRGAMGGKVEDKDLKVSEPLKTKEGKEQEKGKDKKKS